MDTLVLGAVLGAALTLAVQLIIQLGVVPMVQSRARRSGHWEQAVRDLKELLMTSLSDRATDAHAAQGLYVDLLKLEAEPGQIAKIRADHVWEIRKATRAFSDLADTRVGLLTEEIVSFQSKADEIKKFGIIGRNYWLAVAFVSGWKEDDTEAEIDDRWSREYLERTALLAQARLLAAVHHPPRASLRRRVRRWTAARVRSAIAWARTGARRPAISRTR